MEYKPGQESGRTLRKIVDRASSDIQFGVGPYLSKHPKIKEQLEALIDDISNLFYAIPLDEQFDYVKEVD